MPWTAGQVVTAALMNQYVPQTWTTYSPSWTGLSTNPVLGNGSLTGRYLNAGSTWLFSITLTMGSTTTYGTGAWLFSLPASFQGGSVQFPVGQGLAFDVSAGTTFYRTARIGTAANNIALTSESGSNVDSTTFTWATGDRVGIIGFFEAV